MTTKTLTRADIIDTLVRDSNLTRQQASDLLELMLETVITSLNQHAMVKISSFGTFHVHKKGKRIGRNPKTGEEAVISPRRVLSFKPSQYLKDCVQKKAV